MAMIHWRQRRQKLQHVLSLVMVLLVIGTLVGCTSSEPTSTIEESCVATDYNPDGSCSSTSRVEVPEQEDDARDLEEEIPNEENEDDYEYVDRDDEEDENEEAQDEAEAGTKNAVHISWGEPQVVEGTASEMTQKVMDETRQYMTQKVFVEDEFKLIRRECKNLNELCSHWAAVGECETDPEFMIENCSPACQTCKQLEEDFYTDGTLEDEDGELIALEDPGQMMDSRWGLAQVLGNDNPEEVRRRLSETDHYMVEVVYKDDEYEEIRGHCQNKHNECTEWAVSGECEKNAGFMIVQCAPACQTCDKIAFAKRCPLNATEPMVLNRPGDLNRIFEHITTNPYYQANFGPMTIHSSPASTGGPWIVTLDNFVSPEECQRFIDIGHQEGYERSADVGELKFDGTYDDVTSDGRTSTNAWCSDTGCHDDTVVRPVLERIEEMTGVPDANHEWLQLLRYEPGQYYNEHHDFNELEVDRPQGPRILTVFIYLSDVEKGGGTQFSQINLRVMPKRGRVLIWPSVLDENPMEMDERTHHEALPVEGGLKFAANSWLHLRDFKKPHRQGCS